MLQNTSYIWSLCWTTTFIDNVDVLHCKISLTFGVCVELRLLFSIFDVLHCRAPLIFGPCVELRLWLTMWMCCIVKHLIYLALVLNYFSHLLLQCAVLQNTSYIRSLCWTTTLIGNVDVLHCKIPLIFGPCVEIRLWLKMWMCCIVTYLLYLALVLNYFSHLALLICCAAKHLLYLALVLNYNINWHSGCAALQNSSHELVLNYVLNWQCECVELHKTSYFWRLYWTSSVIWFF